MGTAEDFLTVLDRHGIRNTHDLATRYQYWGAARVRDLFVDLARVEDAAIPYSSQLTIAPIGGCLGLGRAEAFLRQILLYADRVLFYDELRPAIDYHLQTAATWNAKQARGYLARAYPYLHQMLLSRRAIEAGMVVIGPRAPLPLETRPGAAILPAAVDALLTNCPNGYAQFAVVNGQPSATFGRGGRAIATLGGAAFAGSSLLVGDPPTSIVPMDAPYRPQGSVVESLARAEFEDRFPNDWAMFAGLLSNEARRMTSAVELSAQTGAALLSDFEEDTALIAAVLGRPVSAASGPEVDAFAIADALDFLEQVPPDLLVQLRIDMAPEFDKFRAAFTTLGEALKSLSGDQRRAEAARIVRDSIRPALADLDQRLRHEHRERLKAAGVVLGSAALTLVAVAATGQQLLSLAEFLALPSLARAVEDRLNVRMDPYFFLYRVREGSN